MNLIKHVELLTNSQCNMNCEFCFLNKNSVYKEFDEEIKEAWKNGTYLKNIKEVFKNLDADPANVESIDLWGGEPTLNYLGECGIINYVDDLLDFFKNATKWNLYTNFNKNSDIIFELSKKIMKSVKEKCNTKASLRIQPSIDGPYGIYLSEGHNKKWDMYNEEFNKIINNFIEYQKENPDEVGWIRFSIRPTINKKVYFEKFSDEKEISNYFREMNNIVDSLNDKINSGSYKFGKVFKYIYPVLALPYDMSVEESIKYTGILRLWDYVRQRDFTNSKSDKMYRPLNSNGALLLSGSDLLSPNIQCSQGKETVLIAPDGTILHCNGAYIDYKLDYQASLLLESPKDYKSSKAIAEFCYNPVGKSEEEIKDINWNYRDGYRGTISIYDTLALGMMEEMALSGQIPWAFGSNKELALKHFRMSSVLMHCSRENCRTTGIPYLANPSAFRRCFNGNTEKTYFENMNPENTRIGIYHYGE